MRLAALSILSSALIASAALAAQSDELNKDHGWLAGTVRAQLDRDSQLVPFGKGAVFVPAMTAGLDEPPITVYRGEEKVEEAKTGERVVLPPGAYEVKVGSGAVDQRFGVQVVVRELHTTIVPVVWAGLAVHVVDDRVNSVRNAYELIRVDGREYVGVGYGADEQAGESVSTWILRPGLYKIVKVGETYRARTNFATVRLLPGRLTHLRLVVDRETGDFKGAGEIEATELFNLGGGLGSNLVVGGDLNFTHAQNSRAGVDEGSSFSFSAYTDGAISYVEDEHIFTTRLQLEEEGKFAFEGKPLDKARDRASIDLLYVYNWLEWLGPYVRAGAETNLLPGSEEIDDDAQGRKPVFIVLEDLEAGDDTSQAYADRGLKLIEEQDGVNRFDFITPAGIVQLKQGAGVNVRFVKMVEIEASARVGVGGRETITRTSNEHVRLNDGDIRNRGPSLDGRRFVEYKRVDDSATVGVEATLLATARITRFFLLNLELDSLLPFDRPQDLVLDLEARLAAKLTRFVSIDYAFRFVRDRSISPEDEIENSVRVRFAIEVL